MKQIFEIFKSDIKEIFRKVNTWIIIVGLIFLPSMYAWPNILSSWDPYSHTNNIKVAVISEDEGATVEGKSVNLGESLITNLKGNKNLDWQFVSSRQQAEDGVKIGDYYASIVIPKSFSSDITSITRGELKKATIEYTVNEKINAISPKITNSGASALANTIGKNFVEVANGVIFEKLHEAGVKFEENLPAIEQVKEKINHLNDNFTNYENSLNELIGKVDRGYNVLNTIQGTLPEIDRAATNSIMLANKTNVTIKNVENFNEIMLKNINTQLDKVIEISGEVVKVAELIQKKPTNPEEAKARMKSLDSRLEAAEKRLDIAKDIFEYLNSLSDQNLFQKQLTKINTMESDITKLRTLNKKIYSNIDNYDAISTKVKADFLTAAKRVNNNSIDFKKKLNTGVAPLIKRVLTNADSKIRNVSSVISRAQAQIPTINAKISEAEVKIKIAQGKLLKLQGEMPEIKEKVQKLTGIVNKADGEIDTNALFNLLKVDYKQQAEFFANPVQLKENQLYHIKNYGSAMTPFYTVLSIWVGALLMSSLLTTKVEDEENRYKPYQKYFGRGLLFMIISLLQTLIITLGDMYLLGTQANSPYRFVIYALLISLLFSAIIYTTVCLLGNVGKAVCIILLVLQIGSSGGTFPIQMTSSFFQALYPKVPFTYSISLLREAVGGVYIPAVNRDMKILLTYLVITLVGGAILVSLKARSAKLSRERERSKLFL
ncbi:YhgE/Pip domain-containing protein [Gemella sanguinis]|uniref:YhgE/Pip domain-containing protein n=1 Tax=Gemella sanguinis TaxID=84135 RepID=UPI0004E1C20D|nr:YhgE/Pip domain-containing protein [Gemella sanguinis]NKZ25312.1 YhgE/Pip domain-containing protein [Gemella sanguinis]